MNTKDNKRKRESREKLERAFMTLLETRRLGQISVSALCKLAGLNRSTFYANYLDVYDLADQTRKRLEDEVAALYAEEVSEGYNSNNFLKLFRHVRDNQPFYKTYFKLDYIGKIQITRYDTELAKRHFGNRHIEYHTAFFMAGFNQIVQMWLERGCQETPEEINQILMSEYQGRE